MGRWVGFQDRYGTSQPIYKCVRDLEPIITNINWSPLVVDYIQKVTDHAAQMNNSKIIGYY